MSPSETLSGCYKCQTLFSAKAIEAWTEAEHRPLCPNCGADAVVTSTAHQPVTVTYLRRLHGRWFDGDGRARPDNADLHKRPPPPELLSALEAAGVPIADEPSSDAVVAESLDVLGCTCIRGGPSTVSFVISCPSETNQPWQVRAFADPNNDDAPRKHETVDTVREVAQMVARLWRGF